MHQSGFVYRIMATNPWVVMIGGLALSFGTMMGTRATDPSKYVKYPTKSSLTNANNF